MSAELERIFPRLRAAFYRVTSPEDENYNCIAWAAEDDRRKWWPSDSPKAYWPIERDETLGCFERAFGRLGYVRCERPDWETGFEKVAIYADASGTPTHMARQLRSGGWTSKLGDLQDVEHETLDQLDSDGTYGYGRAALFLKRKRK